MSKLKNKRIKLKGGENEGESGGGSGGGNGGGSGGGNGGESGGGNGGGSGGGNGGGSGGESGGGTGGNCSGACKERDNLVIFQKPSSCKKKTSTNASLGLAGLAGANAGAGGEGEDKEPKDSSSLTSSIFRIVTLSLYIIIKYPLKYFVLFSILMVIFYLAKKTFEYGCKAIKKFISFFETILNPGDLNLIVLKIPNIFRIFMAFLDLFIGLLYLCVALLFFIALGLLTFPFNLIFAI